jgi:hypothetical protein
MIFRARAGEAEEAWRYEYVGDEPELELDDFKDSDKVSPEEINSDIIRGNFGSFVGMQGYQGHACDQLNIMIPGY